MEMLVRVELPLASKAGYLPPIGGQGRTKGDCEICKRVIPSGIDLRPILTELKTASEQLIKMVNSSLTTLNQVY